MPTLTDLFNQYGGKWYDFGRKAGQPGWFRSPQIDPMGRPVWSPEYGWQDWDVIGKLGGDYSSLTPRFGDWEQYFTPKPAGTSDPELRAKYGQNWQMYLPGAEQQIASSPNYQDYLKQFMSNYQTSFMSQQQQKPEQRASYQPLSDVTEAMKAPDRSYNNMPRPAGYYRQQRMPYGRNRYRRDYR